MTHRFYGDVATWWPLVSLAEDYAEEAAFAATLLRRASIPVSQVLELGSGGGHNAGHLSAHFEMTLVDLSPEMLQVSHAANPTLEHFLGDMRSIRLGRDFDAVFIHDAIDYMATEDDLRAALETAFVHCRPGGVLVVMPDEVRERFEPSTDHGGHDTPDGTVGVRFLEWTWDPDPTDTMITTEYSFVFRLADGSTSSLHETHTIGLFPTATWLQLMSDVGFSAEAVLEVTDEDREPRVVFVGRRPT